MLPNPQLISRPSFTTAHQFVSYKLYYTEYIIMVCNTPPIAPLANILRVIASCKHFSVAISNQVLYPRHPYIILSDTYHVRHACILAWYGSPYSIRSQIMAGINTQSFHSQTSYIRVIYCLLNYYSS